MSSGWRILSEETETPRGMCSSHPGPRLKPCCSAPFHYPRPSLSIQIPWEGITINPHPRGPPASDPPLGLRRRQPVPTRCTSEGSSHNRTAQEQVQVLGKISPKSSHMTSGGGVMMRAGMKAAHPVSGQTLLSTPCRWWTEKFKVAEQHSQGKRESVYEKVSHFHHTCCVPGSPG